MLGPLHKLKYEYINDIHIVLAVCLGYVSVYFAIPTPASASFGIMSVQLRCRVRVRPPASTPAVSKRVNRHPPTSPDADDRRVGRGAVTQTRRGSPIWSPRTE